VTLEQVIPLAPETTPGLGTRLIHLVPEATGGIRDYAENIRHTWSRSGVESRILPLSERQARAEPLRSRVQPPHGDRVDAIVLIVHYSGYGYDPRGLCGWLCHELRDTRARIGRPLRIVVMFHELFASGPPWRSAFWVQGRQAAIAATLAALSDVAVTNTGAHARWLEKQLGYRRTVDVWPVFSNVGEPETLAAFGARARRLVVFGSEPTRRRALARLHRHERQMRELGIDEAVEVGTGHAVWRRPAPMRVSFLGRLDEAALGDLLARSAFGLIEYPAHCMAKSGVFAAYAAHGCVVLNAHASYQGADGRAPGAHFLGLDPRAGTAPPDATLHQMAIDARRWYDRHTLAHQATALVRACGVAQSALTL
jgi:hypothetical protein